MQILHNHLQYLLTGNVYNCLKLKFKSCIRISRRKQQNAGEAQTIPKDEENGNIPTKTANNDAENEEKRLINENGNDVKDAQETDTLIKPDDVADDKRKTVESGLYTNIGPAEPTEKADKSHGYDYVDMKKDIPQSDDTENEKEVPKEENKDYDTLNTDNDTETKTNSGNYDHVPIVPSPEEGNYNKLNEIDSAPDNEITVEGDDNKFDRSERPESNGYDTLDAKDEAESNDFPEYDTADSLLKKWGMEESNESKE